MKKEINITKAIIIDLHGYINIPIIVRDKNDIIEMVNITKLGRPNYFVRQDVVKLLHSLIAKYDINTIIYEQNRLFIDKIEIHPDPFILNNVLFGFGLQTSIEDNFYNNIQYIFAIPNKDWQTTILNSSVKYSIDLYKSHIVKQILDRETLDIIDKYNYYKVLCLSESIMFQNLINVKYQINKSKKGE